MATTPNPDALRAATLPGIPDHEPVARYRAWVEQFDQLNATDLDLIQLHLSQVSDWPRISVFVFPTKGSQQETWSSLAAQIYPNFEVLMPRRAASSAAFFHLDIREVRLAPWRSPAAFFNKALAQATGDFCLAIETSDVLSCHALYLFGVAVLANPHATLIFSDHDEMTSLGTRRNPFFKPSWDPQLALSHNYVDSTALLRADRVRNVGGARPATGDAWRWDLLLRVMDGEPTRSSRVPFMLLHRDSSVEKEKSAQAKAGCDAVARALERRRQPAKISVDPRGWLSVHPTLPITPPHVSIIVVTRDRPDLLRACLDGILYRTSYPKFDVTVVDHNSIEAETFAYFATIERDPRVSIQRYRGKFNFSAIHNEVVPKTRGEFLAFLNNDTDVINSDWLDRMVAHAIDPGVGVVGARLSYPDKATQHAGVIVDRHHGACNIAPPNSDLTHDVMVNVTREVSAVTAACMVMRRSVFSECGGFDENFEVAFGDIDLCMRTKALGYRAIFVANAELYHLESSTRGDPDNTVAGQQQQQRETTRFREQWANAIESDPFYNPNLVHHDDFGLAFPPRIKKPWRTRTAFIERPIRFDMADQDVPDEWHELEHHPEYGSFRWTGPSLRATIRLAVAFDRDFTARIHIISALPDEAIGAVRLSVIGHEITHRLDRLDDGTFLVAARLDCVSMATVEKNFGITLHTSNTARPVDLSRGQDARSLGLAVNWIELDPTC